MSPSIAGLSGGTGNGSVVWNVKTDNAAGYQMNVHATTNPALKSGIYSFADYTPATAGTPDFTWSINATDSEFGYTVEGNSTAGKFLDNGSACNTGSGNTAGCVLVSVFDQRLAGRECNLAESSSGYRHDNQIQSSVRQQPFAGQWKLFSNNYCYSTDFVVN
jgi:hypothetical protein